MIAVRCRYLLWFSMLFTACSEEHRVALDGSDSGVDAETEVVDAEVVPLGCEDDEPDKPPDSLACTGLFTSIHDKSVVKSVLPFKPAFPLWSDGAEKQRWISLPKGTKIDNSNPNEWVFPVGTKLWKEFKVDNKRIETRLLWKTASRWERATYAWNADETAAEPHPGGDIKVAGGMYHLPKLDDCDDCHKGQPDFVLGFSAVNLGLEGASGITLATLAANGWLTKKPALTELSIGADETGLDTDGVPMVAKALGTLHTNCGQTCHNQSGNAKANLTSQNLRLDVTLLDGRPVDDAFNVIGTAVGKRAEGAQWPNHPFRIVPGDPANSLIVQLMSNRDPTGMGRGQMPPIATTKVDEDGVAIVRKWISLLHAGAPQDAGSNAELDAGTSAVVSTPVDSGVDSGMDATTATTMDADTQPVDSATASDAGVDSGVPDLDAGSLDADLDAANADSGSDAGIDAALDPDAGVPDEGGDGDDEDGGE